MNDMTPAQISVERLEIDVVGDVCGPRFEMAPHPAGDYVLYSDYAALLHQLAELQEQADRFHARAEAYRKDSEAAESKLAEREAEVERLKREVELRKHAVDRWVPCPDHRDKVDGRCQVCAKEAAERAREEACGLLREAQQQIYNPVFPEDARVVEDRIAAFLAASGGKVDG